MKPNMPGSDKYHRPVTTRFFVDELSRSVVATPWIDSDQYARADIENRPWKEWRTVYLDHNGYPTA